MKTNYSYKPILLLAIIHSSNDLGETTITEIVDFFMDFYSERQYNRLIVEKEDSTFVKRPNDRSRAKRTIVTYPIAVFVKKGFITYNKITDMVTVAPAIWEAMTEEMQLFIKEHCEHALEMYYMKLCSIATENTYNGT